MLRLRTYSGAYKRALKSNETMHLDVGREVCITRKNAGKKDSFKQRSKSFITLVIYLFNLRERSPAECVVLRFTRDTGLFIDAQVMQSWSGMFPFRGKRPTPPYSLI